MHEDAYEVVDRAINCRKLQRGIFIASEEHKAKAETEFIESLDGLIDSDWSPEKSFVLQATARAAMGVSAVLAVICGLTFGLVFAVRAAWLLAAWVLQ